MEDAGKGGDVRRGTIVDFGRADRVGTDFQKSDDQSGKYHFPQNYQPKFGNLMLGREKGEVTAFLSLIFVLLVSFILAMTESATIQMSKNQKRLDVERAVFSAFGEYHCGLWEEYGVFALDSTYGSGKYDESRVLNRLSYYGAMGIGQEIAEVQLLTDNDGQAFREQVLAYMEERTGISLVRDLAGLAAKWKEQEIQGKEISEELDVTVLENEELLPEEADTLLWARKNQLLSLVLPKDFVLSNKSVPLGKQVSIRARNTGRGSFPAHAGIGQLEERLLFEQYVVEHLGCATGVKGEARSLDYELEYLLCGKASDSENLNTVVRRLLFFRFAANYFFLQTDGEKQSEAEIFAAALSIVLLMPEAMEVVKQLVLVLWAFGESVMDLRSLLGGGRVAMVKGKETWQLQVSSLFQLGTQEDQKDGMDAGEGLTYVEYLQIMLFLENDARLTMRVLDRVEQNLQRQEGVSNFRVDACVTKIKLKNMAQIWNGYTYTFPTYFGYL